jgi:hypothetical protein
MSKVLIQHYLAELAKLRQVSGSQRESVVREAISPSTRTRSSISSNAWRA